jgi:iron(III) transport system substrate-binding protein
MRSLSNVAGPGLAAVLVVTLTACGGSEQEPTATPETSVADTPFLYAGDDRTAYLEECAAEEGALTWYTSLAGPVVDAMVAGFNAEHADITVEVFRGDQAEVVNRVVQENDAGRLEGDVFEVTSEGAKLLGEMGALAPFASPSAEGVSERFTIPGEGGLLGVGDRASYVSFAFNTGAIGAEAAPATLEDLLDPALKGKLAITSDTTGVRFVGNVLAQMGEEDGEAFLRELAQQDVRVEAISGAALVQLLATGEVASSPVIFRNHAAQQVKDGAPLEWIPIEPVTANVGYAGAFKDATNPCAAMLFLDFILGDGGGEIYEGLEYPRPDEDLGFEIWVADENFESSDEYVEAYEGWSALFDELFA